MKRGGILHPDLSHLIAAIGHTDYLVLADKGFPVPKDVYRINLGFMDDHPTVLQVLQGISSEMIIDRIIITQEMEDISPERVKALKNGYPSIRFEKVSHAELKDLAKQAKGVVKTGDTCPYANLIIVSG